MAAATEFLTSLEPPNSSEARVDGIAIARLFPLLVIVAFLVAAAAPVGASIVTVFLFAGPHNWMEARYFLRRMPPRWGKQRAFFLVGLAGAVTLTGAFAVLPWIAETRQWNDTEWSLANSCWNTGLVAWGAALIFLRRRLAPARRDSWAWSIAGLLLVAAWLWPRPWDVALVFAHPLVALWFFDRETAKRDRALHAAYRRALPLVPVFALLTITCLADAPSLGRPDILTERIAWHAGSDLFSYVSDRCPIALHVFLEIVHYGVWMVLLPSVALRAAPWRLGDIPLTRRSVAWRRAVATLLATGLVVVVVLWIGFLVDYRLTRDVYFTAAMFHVLIEIPFLLRFR